MDIKDCHWFFFFFIGDIPLFLPFQKRLSLPYSQWEQAQDKEVNGLRNGL